MTWHQKTLHRPRRSALFLPASSLRAIAKARTFDADVVILDLEDAVAEDAKPAAREAALAALREGGFGGAEMVIRINALTSPWGKDDLAAAARSGADAVLVPKITGADDIARYDAALADAPVNLALWTMIETCAASLHLEALAAMANNTRLGAFVIGTNDLASEMRARRIPGRAPFIPMLVQAVMAARAYGLSILDGVHNDFRDLEGFRAEAEQGAVFGFDGKSLIHPDQIGPCNQIFSPSAADLAWAQTVMAAFALPENAGRGALSINGRMAERLHLDEAKRLIAMDGVIRG